MSYRKQIKQRNMVKVIAATSFIAASILTPNVNDLLRSELPLFPLAPLAVCVVCIILLIAQARN